MRKAGAGPSGVSLPEHILGSTTVAGGSTLQMFTNTASGTPCEHLWTVAGQAAVSAPKQTLHLCRWTRFPELEELQLFRCEKKMGNRKDPLYSFSGCTIIFSGPAKILSEYRVSQAFSHVGQRLGKEVTNGSAMHMPACRALLSIVMERGSVLLRRGKGNRRLHARGGSEAKNYGKVRDALICSWASMPPCA